MENWIYIVIIAAVFLIMNICGFAVMGIDKKKAKAGKWRVPEATLFAFAVCLGGIGCTLGMYAFRHKTNHWYFKVFFPILAVVEVAAVAVGCYFIAVM